MLGIPVVQLAALDRRVAKRVDDGCPTDWLATVPAVAAACDVARWPVGTVTTWRLSAQLLEELPPTGSRARPRLVGEPSNWTAADGVAGARWAPTSAAARPRRTAAPSNCLRASVAATVLGSRNSTEVALWEALSATGRRRQRSRSGTTLSDGVWPRGPRPVFTLEAII